MLPRNIKANVLSAGRGIGSREGRPVAEHNPSPRLRGGEAELSES